MRPEVIQLVGTPSTPSHVRCVRDGATWILEEMVLRPIDLTVSHGYDFTLERLQQCAAAYDPVAVHQAQLNLDHVSWGPSYGPIRSLEMRGDELWMLAAVIDGVLAAEINQGMWPYRSGDWRIQHPATGGLYLVGCAILGAAEPAVWGQRQSVTVEGQISLSATPYRILLGRPAGNRETPMSGITTPAPTATPAAVATAATTAPATTSPAAAVATAAPVAPVAPTATPAPVATTAPASPAMAATETPAAVQTALVVTDAQVVALQAQVAALQRRTALADGELRLTADLTRLQAQLTPAVLRTEGLRAFLLELAAYPSQYTVHLAAAGELPAREVSSYEVLITALSRLPRFEALGVGALASDPVELSTDPRSAEQMAVDARHGISHEQALALRRTTAGYPPKPAATN